VTPSQTSPLTGGGAEGTNTLLTGDCALGYCFLFPLLNREEEAEDTPLTTSPLQGRAKEQTLHLTG